MWTLIMRISWLLHAYWWSRDLLSDVLVTLWSWSWCISLRLGELELYMICKFFMDKERKVLQYCMTYVWVILPNYKLDRLSLVHIFSEQFYTYICISLYSIARMYVGIMPCYFNRLLLLQILVVCKLAGTLILSCLAVAGSAVVKWLLQQPGTCRRLCGRRVCPCPMVRAQGGWWVSLPLH